LGGALETGAWRSALPPLPPLPTPATIRAETLDVRLRAGEVVVLDLAPSPAHRKGHIPGARFAVRARLAEAAPCLNPASRSSSPRPTASWPGSPPANSPP